MSGRTLALALPLVLAATIALAVIVLPSDDGPSAPEPPGPPGFVYRDGTRLYLDAEPYRFTGVNIARANNLGHLGCGPGVDDAMLDRALAALEGSSNAVRAWFFQAQVTAAGERDWTAFDRTLRAIRAHGLKVVVVLADQYGYCGADPPAPKTIEWYESGYANVAPPGFPQTYRDYVHDVVKRYADRPEILAWQLINEASAFTPGAGCPDVADAARVLQAWADDVGGVIRSVDKHHLISLGTGLGGCGIAVSDDPEGSTNYYRHVHSSPQIDLCEHHDYRVPTSGIVLKQQLEMDTCKSLGKAFFVGELGLAESLPNRPALLARKLDAQFGYGRAPSQGTLLWGLGDPPVGSCDENCIRAGDPIFDVLAEYLSKED